jgi:CRISPR-associated protein Csb2
VELSDGSSVFTGCDEAGRPLKGHTHAYILSESNRALCRGQSGEVTHITIYAPAGFGLVERAALEDLREICGSGLHVQLNLLGLGEPEDFGGLNAKLGESPLLAESRAWVSRTPLVPTRHPKVTRAGVPKVDESGLQIGSPEHELRRLLRLTGFPEPTAVEPVAGTRLGGREVPWREFLRRRSSGEGRRVTDGRGYGFRIEFAEAVRGPVAVGYGAHFGMGGFEALDSSD